MDSADDRPMVSALAKLLHDELGEVRFSVTRLARADAEFIPGESGGSTTTTLEPTSKKELDASGLKALHEAGSWKRDLFRFELRVETLPGRPESAARRTEFERLLDDLGVLSDRHVAHALASLLRGYNHSSFRRDSPRESIGVSETTELWRYLLVDACLGTPRRTASKVLRWARGAHFTFEMRVLLGRLHAPNPFVLANGLAVERLPLKSRDLDDWLPTGLGIPSSDYLGRTMLRIPCTIAPVLSKPSRVTRQSNGVPIVSWEIPDEIESTWPLPLGGIHELTRALSLVCDVVVETPMIWTDYGDAAHFGQRYGTSNMGSGEPTPREASESALTAENLKEAIRLQSDLCAPPTAVHTALRYWLKSKARRLDVEDRLVFLRTALEALFLDDGNRTELTFRLATHGAWYTGRNRVERRDRYDVLKNVYGAASGAVHSGRVKKDSAELLKDGQAICRQAIMKRLRSKQEPVWRDIVFGR